MAQSFTEENYLKHIYKLSRKSDKGVSTNALAERLETKASSVTDMIKKLAAKKLVDYKKYQGVTLTNKGQKIAVDIIRKHRLWEVFLLEHLGFGGTEVHEVAEELEHINSAELVERLDKFLGYPKYDPHFYMHFAKRPEVPILIMVGTYDANVRSFRINFLQHNVFYQ